MLVQRSYTLIGIYFVKGKPCSKKVLCIWNILYDCKAFTMHFVSVKTPFLAERDRFPIGKIKTRVCVGFEEVLH